MSQCLLISRLGVNSETPDVVEAIIVDLIWAQTILRVQRSYPDLAIEPNLATVDGGRSVPISEFDIEVDPRDVRCFQGIFGTGFGSAECSQWFREAIIGLYLQQNGIPFVRDDYFHNRDRYQREAIEFFSGQ